MESDGTLYYPLMLNVRDKSAVVVGGGHVARRKVKSLMNAGARVTVIAPDLHSDLRRRIDENQLVWKEKSFESTDIAEAGIVIAATNDMKVNREVAEAVRPDQLLNVVDEPDHGNFVVPAVLRRGKLLISVSTSGASPLAAAMIRDQIAEKYDETYAGYIDFLNDCRHNITETISCPVTKRSLYEEILDPVYLRSLQKREQVLLKIARLSDRNRS